MHIGWVVNEASATVASTRYRCYYPIAALQRLGITSSVFRKSADVIPYLATLDAIVFVKHLDGRAQDLAARAAVAGIRIYIDLCDNVVVPNYGSIPAAAPLQRERIAGVAALADGVVTTNSALSDAFRDLLPRRLAIVEIPDQTETREAVQGAQAIADRVVVHNDRPTPWFHVFRVLMHMVHVGPKASFALIRSKLTKIRRRRKAISKTDFERPICPSGRKTVLWFGNYGAPHSDFGMLSLLGAAADLEKLATEIDFELVVISNNEGMYRTFIAPLALPTRYLPWTPDTLFEALSRADVCLLPGGSDKFSETKSANRVVLSLQHGVPVVTSRLASLEPLAQCVTFDDWSDGLRRFLVDAGARQAAIEKSRQIIDNHYSPQVIGELWEDLLLRASGRTRRGHGPFKVGVVLDLGQDLDVLLPVIDELRLRRGVAVRLILSDVVAVKSPRVLRALIKRSIVPFLVSRQAMLRADDRAIRDLHAIISASESTSGPHRFSHALAQCAENLRIATFCLQHGIENVGLTYIDEANNATVDFASKRILTWAPAERLPAWVSESTREKCIAVGRTASVTDPMPRPSSFAGRTIIGVFENLHWDRYSKSFRDAFIQDLLAVAAALPDVLFCVKPHHAGQHMKKHREAFKNAPSNIMLIDPQDPIFEPYTAKSLIAHCAAVVTTPSTVALDAAELNVPVAIAAYDLKLPLYEPLPMLCGPDDWLVFVSQATDTTGAASSALATFRDATRVPGNAAKRVVDIVLDIGDVRQAHLQEPCESENKNAAFALTSV